MGGESNSIDAGVISADIARVNPRWTWHQRDGRMDSPDGKPFATGYAGRGAAKNDPDSQCVRGQGPLPRGVYRLVRVYDSPKTGPFTIELVPDRANLMCGRGAFRIHGDSAAHPGWASEGCIVLPRSARDAIWASKVHLLEVVA